MTDILKTIETKLTKIYSLPYHARPNHWVVIGELSALANEETVFLVTHLQLKRSRIVRH